ncbi:MAG: hypothetical protein ACRYHA_10595 [Janthinobacterium lividum]
MPKTPLPAAGLPDGGPHEDAPDDVRDVSPATHRTIEDKAAAGTRTEIASLMALIGG